MITKSDLESNDSFSCAGGRCFEEESDYDTYFEDTMRQGIMRIGGNR